MLRAVVLLALVGVLVAGVAGVLALERAPRAPMGVPPTPEDVAAARDLLQNLRDISETPGNDDRVTVTADEMNGLFRIGARTLPGLGGQARIEGGALAVDLSLPMPGLPDLGWLNLTAVIPPFEEGVKVRELRLGRLPLPPGLAQSVALEAIDRRFGDALGSGMVKRFPRMALSGEAVVVDVAIDVDSRQAMARSTFEALHGNSMPTLEDIAAHVAVFEAARGDGRLPVRAPLFTYYELMLDAAAERAAARPDDPLRELVAGFLAIGHVCGTPTLLHLIGPRPSETMSALPDPGPICAQASLSGRRDLRQHFVTAAAIKAASTRSVALSAGEAKELLDLFRTGFDFTDMAANNSGIRFAERLFAAAPEDWPRLARAVTAESDVMIPLDGLPGAMTRAEFEERFGAVDSPGYLRLMDQIEARIDALPFHAM